MHVPIFSLIFVILSVVQALISTEYANIVLELCATINLPSLQHGHCVNSHKTWYNIDSIFSLCVFITFLITVKKFADQKKQERHYFGLEV